MSSGELTTLAAWWGAIIATVVLLWDFYKWKRSGVDLQLSVRPNMITAGIGEPKDKKFISVTVTNRGDRPTTITNMLGHYYPSRFRRLRGKPEHSFVVANPAFGPAELPCVLKPGERWLAGTEQSEELENWSQEGFLYLGISNTASRREMLKRVLILPKLAH